MNKKNVSRYLSIQGIIGFLLGACLAVFGVTWFSVQRAAGALNESYDLTAVALAATDTPTPTPIYTPTPTPRPRPEAYYDVLEEAEFMLFDDPQDAISVIEKAMEDVSDPLDLVVAYRLLAEAHMILEDYDVGTDYHKKIIDLLQPLVGDSLSIRDLSKIYVYLIKALMETGDEEAAEDYYRQMGDKLEPLVRQSTYPPEIGEVYQNLVKASSYVWDYISAGSYFNAMVQQLDPFMDDLVSVREIIETYSYLNEAGIYSGGVVDDYMDSQDIVDKLVSLRDELTSTEDIILVNKFLGDIEFAHARYQFAPVYYRELVEYEPTPENIFLLAVSYDVAGNLTCAYHWYQELLAMEDNAITLYKDTAEFRRDSIEELYQGDDVPFCRQL